MTKRTSPRIDGIWWMSGMVLAAVVSVLFVGWALRWQHSAEFRGICGPHAPDVSAHPCSQEEHDREFGAGFAGIGLITYQASAAIFAVMVLAAVRRVRAR